MVEQAVAELADELIGDTKDAYQWDRALIETEFLLSSWSPSPASPTRQNPEPRRASAAAQRAAARPSGETLIISKRSKPKSVP